MDYSEYRIEREGQRNEDHYVLYYEPHDSPVGVRENLPLWIANLVKAALLEKCPANVIERQYGGRQESDQSKGE